MPTHPTPTPAPLTDPATIRAAFAAARAQGLRAVEAAAAIGLTEGAVVAAHVGTHDAPLQAQALQPQWLDLLNALEACGPVMALTRNAAVVHEKDGLYRGFTQQGMVGLCNHRDIDLRLFFMHWRAGFAVTEPGRDGQPTRSLQFYDAQGVAVHKIYARPHTDVDAWQALVARFASTQALTYEVVPAPAAAPVAADSSIDADGLRAAWAAMQDTHAFFGLLKQFGCERQQSFRLTQGQFCTPLALSSVTTLLEQAAQQAVPIMVFVGSKGCIQIHSGPVQRIVPMVTPGGADWINVLDAGFNLHLRRDLIATAWLVRKPTSDGTVTSVELFDTQGESVAMFFGERKPGQSERADWRALAEGLPQLDAQEVTA